LAHPDPLGRSQVTATMRSRRLSLIFTHPPSLARLGSRSCLHLSLLAVVPLLNRTHIRHFLIFPESSRTARLAVIAIHPRVIQSSAQHYILTTAERALVYGWHLSSFTLRDFGLRSMRYLRRVAWHVSPPPDLWQLNVW
jgi:hypothetical protein